MSRYDKVCETYAKPFQARNPMRARYQWRIGNTNVSTEELEAWQLGPILPRRPYIARSAHTRGGGKHGL
jgi:hypothetical protein